MIETISIFLVILQESDAIVLFKQMISLQMMSMIAYSDLMIGRIPRHFFIFSGIIGLFLDIVQIQPGFYLCGGIFSFSIMSFMYVLGKKYYQRRTEISDAFSGFGFGDVFASGALGFLFGFSKAMVAVIMALIFAVAVTLYRYIKQKEWSFFKGRIRLGPYFLVSTSIIVFVELLSF